MQRNNKYIHSEEFYKKKVREKLYTEIVTILRFEFDVVSSRSASILLKINRVQVS